MKATGINIGNGFRIGKSGKVERIPGYGLDASKKAQQKKSKKVRVSRVPSN